MHDVRDRYHVIKAAGGPPWQHWVRLGAIATAAHRAGYSAFSKTRRSTLRGKVPTTVVTAKSFAHTLKLARASWVQQSSDAQKTAEDINSTVDAQMARNGDELDLPSCLSTVFSPTASSLPSSVRANQPANTAFIHVPADKIAEDRVFSSTFMFEFTGQHTQVSLIK